MIILKERKKKVKMKNEIKETKLEKVLKKIRKLTIFICSKTLFVITTPIVYAVEESDNPLTIVNNLSDFIFQIVQAVGVIMVLFGLVQFGLALKSHDPSQRASSLFTILGGIVIACAKTILKTIMG